LTSPPDSVKIKETRAGMTGISLIYRLNEFELQGTDDKIAIEHRELIAFVETMEAP
jgi:hypothetical protein